MATQAISSGARSRPPFRITPYLFLLPAIVSILLLTFYPIAYTVNYAFTNFNLYHFNSYDYVGFKNFTDLFSSSSPYASVFASVLTWTVAFAVITSALNYILGFLLAVLLNNPRLPERVIYRVLLIVPMALPSAITVLVWKGMFDETFGIINGFFTSIGLPGVHWLSDTNAARIAILIVNLWLGFPFNMIVCLGGLQSIPHDIYESASIDGATAFDRLRLLTLPLVFQVTLPMLVSAFSFNMTNFNVIYLLNKGGPPRTDGNSLAGTTDVLSSFTYNLVGISQQYGKAAAMGIIIFFITAILTSIGLKYSGAFKEIR